METPVICSIVIPVFNNCFYTRLCLDSLRSNRAIEPPFEIIVVDNGSTDDTAIVLNQFETDIAEIIRNPNNLGFAVASNQGAARARGKYLVFLNYDVIVEPGWLTEMVTLAEGNPEIGAIGARLLYPDGTLQHAGVVFGADRHPRHVYSGFPADWSDALKTREYQAVTGACMLVDKHLFETVEGFDERYVNSHEDVDLCFKIRKAGRKVYYCPNAVAIHFESVTAGRNFREDLASTRFLESWRETVIVADAPIESSVDPVSTKLQLWREVVELTHRNRDLLSKNANLRRLTNWADKIAIDRLDAGSAGFAGPRHRDVLYCPGRINIAVTGRDIRVPVAIMNLGSQVLPGGTLNLSYHWRRPDTNEYESFEGRRTNIDEPVGPGQVVSFLAWVTVPNCVGRLILEWDAVEEGVTWLSRAGVPPYRQSVTIRDVRNVVATVLKLPLALEAGCALNVDVQVIRGTADAQDYGDTRSMRWVRSDDVNFDAFDVYHDPPSDSVDGVHDELRHACLVAPSSEGTYRLILGETQADGAWIPYETVGGTTQIFSAKRTGGPSERRENLSVDRTGETDPRDIIKPVMDWQSLAEEAEYCLARVRQTAGQTTSELARERQRVVEVVSELEHTRHRAKQLARLVDGYRNGRIMRGLSFIWRLWSALPRRGHESQV